jgi:phosphatidylinositol alpha-1,6-mannosyltransferase
MIVGLFPSILQSGGIQRVSRHAAIVLHEIANSRGSSCHLLSLNDPSGEGFLKSDNFNLKILGFGRDKKQFSLAALRLVKKSDLVYIAHPNLAPIGFLLKLLRPSARYVVTAHGADVWEPLSILRRWGLQGAAAVTAPSNFTAAAIAKTQGLDLSRVTVLPWAIEPKLIKRNGTAHRISPSLPTGKVLLTVGRMDAAERLKGVEEVLRALPSVLDKFPDTYYVIIGEGDDRERLQLLAKELEFGEHVLFIGHTSDEELAGYYEACDVFVMPSRQEGFGLVFLEAMAFGKPVIGGDHGGTPEIVHDDVHGFLVQHGDVETLSLRLKRLLGEPELRHRMGEAGRRRVSENYSFDTFRQAFVRLLTEKGLLNLSVS